MPTPWFFVAPRIFYAALQVSILPFRLFVMACEVVVALTFTAVIVAIAAWWFKLIPDAEVGAFIASFGDRVQGILKGAGMM